jgi:hypothetical protein
MAFINSRVESLTVYLSYVSLQELWADGGSERKTLTKVLKSAIEHVVHSQGLVKTTEALRALDVKFQYDIAVKPTPLPKSGAQAVISNSDLLAFFAVPEGWASSHGTTNHLLLSNLHLQWISHCNKWLPPTASSAPYTPSDVYEYWRMLAAGAKELSELAIHHWSSPVSNAAPERVFSILTHMDDPRRRTMEHLSLENQLFLRANNTIVSELGSTLVSNIADSRTASTSRAVEASKRRREPDSASDQAAEMAMLHVRSKVSAAIAAANKKRVRIQEMSDDEDQHELLTSCLNKEAVGASGKSGEAEL